MNVRLGRMLLWSATAMFAGLAIWLTADASPLVRMVAIIAALFAGLKPLVAFEWHRAGGGSMSPARWLAFGFGWIGMRPNDFVDRRAGREPIDPGPGAVALAVGLTLLAAARTLASEHRAAAAFLALPAISAIAHFGLLRLAAARWRAYGFDVSVPFDAPWRSQSLRELWRRRWNRPFSDMTVAVVYQPLAHAHGRPAAVLAGFALSGVLHELAISVPVRAGYGGPLAYFLLHGALMLLEPVVRPKRPALARAWTLGWVLLPLPLLFHGPFREGVILPLLS